MAEVRGNGPAELRVLAVKLRAADPALRARLRREFRQAAGPVVRKVRESILLMPSHHDGTLRGHIAGTVTSSTGLVSASGVRAEIVSRGSRMPQGQQNLPAHADEARGWGHPVFADRSKPRSEWTWVRQAGKPRWFEEPVTRAAGAFRDACQRAMDEVRRELG